MPKRGIAMTEELEMDERAEEQEDAKAQHIEKEEFSLSGGELLDKVKDLLHQGNIRRIVIKHDGSTILELPLTFAAVGVLIAPQLAAVGAVAALLTRCSIVVERIVED